MARVNGKNEFNPCKYNIGVECDERGADCLRCGFHPDEWARRVAEIRERRGCAAEELRKDGVD